MNDVTYLWVDARLSKAKESYYVELNSSGRWGLCNNVDQAVSLIEKMRPDVVVYDFDYADIIGLKSLRRVRENFPFMPVVMLAEQHYESLAIWALRCRVWDYLLKPFDRNAFVQQLEMLVKDKNSEQEALNWMKLLPSNRIPNQALIIGNSKNDRGVCAAISYMEANLHRKLSAEEVSQQCGLTRYELSRAFKARFSLTFRDFLLKLRMSQAARMLNYTEASVTDISLSVGFNDVSNFTRRFHQFYSSSPSEYRRNGKAGQLKKSG